MLLSTTTLMYTQESQVTIQTSVTRVQTSVTVVLYVTTVTLVHVVSKDSGDHSDSSVICDFHDTSACCNSNACCDTHSMNKCDSSNICDYCDSTDNRLTLVDGTLMQTNCQYY